MKRKKAPVTRTMRWGIVLSMSLVATILGCSDTDVGRCCRAVEGAEDVRIPEPVQTDNGLQNVVSRDRNFDCEYLTCVAYEGSSAYCTRDCFDGSDCPDGFECRSVLETDPGPGSNIQLDDKFCVRAAHQCTE